MGLFNFFRRAKAIPVSTPPTSFVEFDEDKVTCTRSTGLVESVRWADLQGVLINTTSDGPASDDFFWVLVGKSSGCVVASEAEGCNRLLERLQKLPGFDNKAVILASQCVNEQSFLCWERQAETGTATNGGA